MVMEHEHDCACCTCKRVQVILDQENRAMKERGWYAHVVCDDPQSPTSFNYHTHGFWETLEHPDIQIVLPMSGTVCHSIAGTVFHRIQGGETFKNGEKADSVIKKFDVVFIQVRESNRDVLRIILPGKNGETEPLMLNDDEDPEYSLQWTAI